MDTITRRRDSSSLRTRIATTVAAAVVGSLGLVGAAVPAVAAPAPAGASSAESTTLVGADAAGVEYTQTLTSEQTVTVHETVTIGEFVGHGSATATASASATKTATAATFWDAFFEAYWAAYAESQALAAAAADDEARPIARAQAQADAEAKAAAGVDWTETVTSEQTVTVHETVTIGEFVGHGSATATASASATKSVNAATFWDAYFGAYWAAYAESQTLAAAAADAEARPIARAQAQADAEAKAAAGVDWTETSTQEATVTVSESATVGTFTGYGTSTATASSTATRSANAATFWDAYFEAYWAAYAAALSDATALADAEARQKAREQAQADAQAQYDAAAALPPPSCGDAVTKADGTPWVCTFSDDFEGAGLDPHKWTSVATAESNFHYGDCLLGGSSENVTVGAGVLSLTTKKEAAPVTCQDYDGSFTTDYTSGSVTTLYNFSQTFGRFEIRAAMPATDGPGLHSAIWLWPDDPEAYGVWPGSGEIDIAEFYSAYPDRIVPAVHYNALLPMSDRTNNNCLVDDPTEFHTYGLSWTPQKLSISIDGVTCLEHAISPLAPLLGSAPFDRPFNLNLTQVLGSATNALPEGSSIESPATMQVDYVRVWS